MYAEAYITVTSYSLELDVLVVNQTDDTLQNCTLELCVWGRRNEGVTEKPAPVILAPKDFTTLRAIIEVSGTESGLIFGTIVYDIKVSVFAMNCDNFSSHQQSEVGTTALFEA